MAPRNEIDVLVKTFKILVDSQIGHAGRKAGENLSNMCWQAILGAGPVHRPFDGNDQSKSMLGAEPVHRPFDVNDQSKIIHEAGIPPISVEAVTSKEKSSTLKELPPSDGLSLDEERHLINAARKVGVNFAAQRPASYPTQKPGLKTTDHELYRPTLPKNYRVSLGSIEADNLKDSHERHVPSSRIGRLANFGMLAVGLGSGAAAEVVRRTFGAKEVNTNPFVTPANAERIVQTLCRVRGAALKIGQMLSLQDESLVPPYLVEILERVRHGADFMPFSQVEKQMKKELGDDWQNRFASFEEKPFAAASIGQVHRAVSLDGKKLAIKIQYPGVAAGIDADIDNLVSILSVGGLLPKGMFIKEFVSVARRELKAECDYELEAQSALRFRELLSDDSNFYVPHVFSDLSSKCVLTMEYIEGKPVDACLNEPQEVRDYLAAKFIELCLKELFLWRFMQTDPNWSNFFLGRHPVSGEPRLILLDFGASRTYSKKFADLYMRILKAAYDNDREAMLGYSRKIGFLTGYESKVMEQAHCDSISILGETFTSREPYDFSKQDVTKRIQKRIPVMLEHRLTPPPEEIYSLHRKLSGAYLLATKLKAIVSCGPIFVEIYNQYKFDDEEEKSNYLCLVMLSNLLRSSVLLRWKSQERVLLTGQRYTAKASVDGAVVKVRKPKKPKESMATADAWKRDLVFKMNTDIKIEHRRYAVTKEVLGYEHKVVCFIRDGRIFPLLNYVNTLARKALPEETSSYSEIFAVSLKRLAEHLEEQMKQENWIGTKDSKYFIENLVETLVCIPLSSNDIVLINCYALVLLKKWKASDLENFDDYLATFHAIGQLEGRLEEYFRTHTLQQNQFLFSANVLKMISDHFNLKDQWAEKKIINLGYDEDLNLVSDLFNTCPDDKYRGSPFALPSSSKERFEEQFRKQLFDEQRQCFAIKNYARTSVEKPMEKVLLEWRWDKALASTFKQMLEKVSSITVQQNLRGLDGTEVAGILYECVLSVLCQGKNLVSLQELEFHLTYSVFALTHKDFVKKILSESSAMFEDVCREYFRYFYEPDLSRQYNIREWWYFCTQKFNVDPEFRIPFTNFASFTGDEVSAFLIDVIINACKIPENKLERRSSKPAFSFRNVHIAQLMDDDRNKSELVKMFDLDPVLINLIAEHQFEFLLFPFHTLPMTIPPRPWMDGGTCGPMFTRSSEVVRNVYEFPIVNVNFEMTKRLKDSAQARPVFDTLNDLGATPWIINKSMLKELIRAFDFSYKVENKQLLKSLAIAMHSSTIQVPTIHEYFNIRDVSNISSTDWFKFSKMEHTLIKEQNESNSLWCWLMYRIVLANHYRDEVLYFPHNMDFRGRVYPVSPHLNHMGDDINRCLLKFARGKPLGEKGFEWLKLHCINLTGLKKKCSIAERLEFAEENMDNILKSANDPWAKDSWWLSSEEPWQTLSACIEIRDVLKSGQDPRDFVSHLPVHQDGSCNGFQHYAALGRDQQGASEVNLLPTEFPADIYSNVAARVEESRIKDENSEDDEIRELALDLRAHIKEPMPRKVIKQTVMTTIYGVTMFGAREQIKRQLKAIEIPSDKLLKFSSYIAKKTLGSLNESFESSMKLKDWFRHCARAIVKLMQPVEWVTPLGLPVVQPYLKASKKFDLLCNIPIQHKQVDAFPPNFVHSLDSTHMMLTTLYCRQKGVTFAAVHDCFWTHAADVEIMNEICRDQFIQLHKQPIVENLGKQFKDIYLTQNELKSMSPETFQSFNTSFTPRHKRGSLDIEQIRKSVLKYLASSMPDPQIYNLDSMKKSSREFNLSSRYYGINIIGEGSYGVVASALDLNIGQRVAIKKISSINLPTIALRTFREIQILRHLNHENIINVLGVEQFDKYNEIYIIQPLIEWDLHNLMCRIRFEEPAIAFVIYQMFRGLKYMHDAQIIHRDIKPSNILIHGEYNVKICDFGLARFLGETDEDDSVGLTEYVATRWYRAPEIMIASRRYDKAIDVWSVGCILAELLDGSSPPNVLFPGRNYMEMLKMMISVLGTPTEEDLSYVVNERARGFVIGQVEATRIDWHSKFRFRSKASCDLLDRILTFNPSKRIKIEEALNYHPFLKMS